MKVLLVNTSDIQGGAARAAYRLHRGLQQIDVESKMLVQTKVSDDFSVTTSAQSKVQKLVARLRPILDSGPVGLYKHRTKTLFSPALFPFSSVAHRISTANVDVAHLHWIAGGMLRIEDVAKIKKPIVWTLHDMWAFTGGCHLDGECGRYKKFCGKCPILSSTRNVDLSRWILKRKQKAWSNINITIVTPSRWLAKCASSSSLFRDRRIEVIANGLDISRYQLMDKSVARRLLSLPQDKRLILFGAMSSTGDRNKGFQFLHPALRELAKDNWGGRVEVIVFGASEPTSPPDFGLKTSYLGRFHDDISLALLYAAADVFLAPSVQDNLPNTVMESLACGTPCVAFNIGGMPDLVEHERTGYLAQPYDPEDLAKGIAWVLEDDERRQILAYQSRQKVEREYALKTVARRYLNLYEDILVR